MANLDTKAALPDDIAVALDHGAITERDAADEMAKRLRAAVAEVERLTGERDKAMLLVSGGAAELEAAAKEKVHSLDALVCSVSEERDKALADRKVLVEALRLVVAFDRARQHPDETGRISVPRLNEILWKCADALRAVGEEP